MRSRPSLKLLLVFGGIAIVLTATPSNRAAAAEQARAPILIPNIHEPAEMRVPPFSSNVVLTPADRMLGEVIKGIGKNDIHAMLPAINRVIAAYPEYAAAYVFRLGVLCDGNDKDAVLSDVDNAIKFSDSSQAFGQSLKQSVGSLYGMRAKIEYLKGDYIGAVNDLDKAVHADLTKPSDFINTGGVKPEKTASLCTWTEPAVDALVQRFPQDYRTHLIRGLYFAFFVSFDVKWQKSAIEELHKAGALNSMSALPSFFTAQLLHNPLIFYHRVNEIGFGVNQEVLPYYNQALSIDHNLIPALKGRAAIYFELKQYQLAIADYNKVISAEPKDWADYHDRGLAKMLSGSPYEAISDFTAAIKIGRELKIGRESSGYKGRAAAYVQTRQWDLAIADFNTAISLEIGGILLLGNVRQFREIYPEYAAASDEAIGRKLNQTFYPNLKYENLSKQFLNGQPLPSTTLPDLYLKRSDAYLQKGDWHHASIDFRRAMNGFPDYAPITQRWREFGHVNNTHNYVDLKTFDDARTGSVKLWIKEATGEGGAFPYKLFHFELNCNAQKIRVVSWAEYDASGMLVRNGERNRWGSVVPDTLGENLEHGACGTS